MWHALGMLAGCWVLVISYIKTSYVKDQESKKKKKNLKRKAGHDVAEEKRLKKKRKT
jgi:hypothetical protein